MRFQIAIAVKEQEYVSRLAEYVRSSPFSEQWQLTAFTNPDAFTQFLKGGYPVDFIAAEPSMLDAAGDAIPSVPIVALVTARGQSYKHHELMQFQPLPELLQSISSLHAANGNRTTSSSDERMGKVISVYSASGGVGKTTLSLQLVNTAASNGYRVFYLNLEKWNAMEACLGPANSSVEGEGLSQLLYGLKSQPDKVSNWLAQHRKRHPVLKGDYVLPFSNTDDRLTLQASDAEAIIQNIVLSGLYDLIVIDLDDGLDELHLALFEQSDQVIWVITDDPAVQRKCELAYRYGERRWSSQFQSMDRRYQFIVNRHYVSDSGQSEPLPLQGFKTITATLPEIQERNRSAPASVIASPLYKAAVEKLFQHLVKEGGARRIVN
ncbi:MAG: AAA family ATPase [Candidatus Pristimantibacillus sp.]